MTKLRLRLPAGSARAVIAAAGLAVVALFIAVYGNAQARSDRQHGPDHHYNPLTQSGWNAVHPPAESLIPALPTAR